MEFERDEMFRLMTVKLGTWRKAAASVKLVNAQSADMSTKDQSNKA
jgi:hypothetical protein